MMGAELVPKTSIIFNKLTQLIARECVVSGRIRNHGRQEGLLVSWKQKLISYSLTSVAFSICSVFYSVQRSGSRLINFATFGAHYTKFPQIQTTSEGPYSGLMTLFADLLTNLH
jgi:hypothetical protein